MGACGLDFGTSNTALGVPEADGPELCDLEDGHRTVPSAVFFGFDGSTRIGRAAIDAYVEGEDGRLMRGLKSVLGSSLLAETTRVGRRNASFRDVIATFLQGVKSRAERVTGRELTAVVHGRPVHFVDGDPAADGRAEDALAGIAREIGFSEVVFQYEPIAAALDYEQVIVDEELALVADIGGGTSDFSIVRISPRSRTATDRGGDILASDGVRIGGADFDRVLSLRTVMPLLGLDTPMRRAELDVPNRYFHDLASWHGINRLYDRKVLTEIRQVRREAARPDLLDRLIRVIEDRRGHALAAAVERAKIELSTCSTAGIPLDRLDPGLGVSLRREDLSDNTAALASGIAARVREVLRIAGLDAGRIDALFLTGGSTRLPHVRAAIVRAVPDAKIVDGDTFGSVGKGLTIEARRRFGPIEIAAAGVPSRR